MFDELLQDTRFALRTLLKNRGFTLSAILTLGLGIGANTAIFSVVHGVLLKPLPYADADRLVLIRQSAPLAGRADVGVSIREYFTYRDEATDDFDGLVEFHQMNFDLLKRGEPDRVNAGVVSPNFFNVLGISPILGRSFVAADNAIGAPATLLISYAYWQRKFGGDPAIVGQVFEMNDRPHTVIGVLPNVPHYPQENDVYMPTAACPFRAQAETTIGANPRGFSILNVFGKLKPGIARERASAAVAAIFQRVIADNPSAYRAASGFTATTADVREEMTRNARPMLLILLGTTVLVLLIACANVANLSLARLLRRERELSVRTALGAGRGRLARQLLTESTILALAGGAVGLLFASWANEMLVTFVSRFTPRTGEINIDLRVLLFAIAISIATGLLFGAAPALASRADLSAATRQTGKGVGDGSGRGHAQNALVVAQVAVSVVLLVGAGLLLSSFYRLQSVDPGYRADRVMSAELFTNFSKYPDVDAQRAFYLTAIERLEAQPGVVSVAVTNAVPLRASQPGSAAFLIEGQVEESPDRRPTADARIVTPQFFQLLGVPIVAGRPFAETDSEDAAKVVVINNAMTRYWNGRDPLGSRISLDNGQTWSTVVGIVGDVRQFGLDRPAVAQVYTPLRQTAVGLAGLALVRANVDDAAAANMIRDTIWSVDPNMPITNLRTLDEIRDRYLATPKLTAALLLVFAALALLVTMVGVTGVLATSVSHRTHEFGVRMALGSSPQALMRMVVGQGLMRVGIGLAIGLAASVGLSRVLSAYLFDTAPTDPLTFVLVATAFVIAGVIACVGPRCARRRSIRWLPFVPSDAPVIARPAAAPSSPRGDWDRSPARADRRGGRRRYRRVWRGRGRARPTRRPRSTPATWCRRRQRARAALSRGEAGARPSRVHRRPPDRSLRRPPLKTPAGDRLARPPAFPSGR
jgi:putative ABC transport system permease protein